MLKTPIPFVPALWALAAAILSGCVGAVFLEPVMGVSEQFLEDSLFGILGPFALTAGLAFGVLGGAVLLRVMGERPLTVSVFLASSILGMAAAVYVAIMSYDNTTENFVTAYAVASPLGALLVVAPFAVLARLAEPLKIVAAAVVLPTLWSMGVAAVLDGDAALDPSGLAALYTGWQGIVLVLLCLARRKPPAVG